MGLKRVSALILGLLLTTMLASGFTQSRVKRGTHRGIPNQGGSAKLRQTATATGYEAGLAAGRSDRQRNEKFNFTDESDYKSATKGYSSSLGDRTIYQRYFRAGFENGYRDGWNGY